jgi:hypothetical protein
MKFSITLSLFLLLVLFSLLSCAKRYPEFPPAVTLPANYVYVPNEVRERFWRYNYDIYWHSWIREYPWAVFYINLNSDTEVYPQDTVAYKIKSMNKKAYDLFWLLFHDQLDNRRFLDTFQMKLTQHFRWEANVPYRKSLSVLYRLNDSLFIK